MLMSCVSVAFQRPLDGFTPSVMPQPVRLVSVCILKSGFGVIRLWHAVSISFIHWSVSYMAFYYVFILSKLL